MIQSVPQKDFMPVTIRISGKKILLVGGGKVAMEKIVSLRQFTSDITIVSKDFDPEIRKLPYSMIKKEYDRPDITGFFLVYACTNRSDINSRIKEDCNELGILVNVVDNPKLCDFVSPAIYVQDYMSVAVSSDGRDVRRSIDLRNRIQGLLNGKT